MTLLSKDIPVKSSFVYGGYLIVKELRRAKNAVASFYTISETLTKADITQYKQQVYCLMFLYACDIIEFEPPYIKLKNYDH